MKKIANFIVSKRIFILAAFVLLAAVSVLLIPSVNVNINMSEYLPSDSDASKGLDVLEAEFDGASTLRLMFTGLGEDDRTRIIDQLGRIENVASVEYEAGSADYNSGEHTLIVLNIEGDSYSTQAGEVLAMVRDVYAGRFELKVAGTAADGQSTSLDSRLIILALSLLVAILFITCSSWIEPLLFIIAIAIAILINLGTNIIFPSVSSMTNSIAAILQLALSMDYSIMLMDRYRQERLVSSDREQAMRAAIAGGFPTIAGSSLTTVVGLLCLVFMSFTIGVDMGLVLAKGVFFSLISVLLVLPALIILFDRVIEKTRKKAPDFKMAKLARFSHKARFFLLGLFAVLFVGGFVLKDKAVVEFVSPSLNIDQSAVEEVFPEDNTIVLLYGNGDEEKIRDALEELSGREDIESLLAYSNTLSAQLSAKQLAEELGLEQEIVAMLMFEYGGGVAGKMGVGEFLAFLSGDIAGSEQFSDYISDDMAALLERSAGFADAGFVTAPVSAEVMAGIFEMDAAAVQQLYMLYFNIYGGVSEGSMTLAEFAQLVQAAAQNPQFAGAVDPQQAAQLAVAVASMPAEALTVPLESDAMAAALSMDAGAVRQLYLYRQMAAGDTLDWLVSPLDFVRFLVKDIAADPVTGAGFSAEQAASLRSALAVMEAAVSGQEYDAGGMYELLFAGAEGVEASYVELLYLYRFGADADAQGKVALYDFIVFVADTVAADPRFEPFFDAESLAQLSDAKDTLLEAKSSFVGPSFSRAIITTGLEPESEEAFSLVDAIRGRLEAEGLSFYLVGNSPMAHEMRQSFSGEMNFITLLTVISIFVVVALTFRSIWAPLLLVLLIQCAVFMTTAASFLQGEGTYYLALIIVQAILMGATIDYAILFTEYYRGLRRTEDVRGALAGAYRGSFMTILTSSSILIGVTLVVGIVIKDPAVSQICLTISKGSFFATMLVVFVLPALLAVFDPLIRGKDKKKKAGREK